MKNKIGWCNLTFNPAWGCRSKCPYCYARRIASFRYDRIAEKEYNYLYSRGVTIFQGKFANRLRHFVPTFIESNFYKKLPKKPQRIFVGSMSEIAHWEQKWIVDVIHKIEQYPQHIFQFLTKYPSIYQQYEFPDNCWLGVTIIRNPKEGEADRWDYYEFKQHNKNNLKFVCFEPLLMDMQLIYFLNLEGIDWVIVGSETGNRKDKVIPEPKWVKKIIDECRMRRISIYLKDSLKEIYPEEIKEFPKIN